MAINLNLSASKGLRLAIGLSSLLIATLSVSDSSAQIAPAPSAHVMGAFGTPHNWPIMPIAMMLMPNGTVFAYGTDTGTGANAKQDTQQYAVWDTKIPPAWTRGSATSAAFQLLPNDTKSNIFCSAQVHLLPNRALIIGGDVDNNLGFATNDGNNNVVVFESINGITGNPSITNREKMPWPRWYRTAVTLPNRDTLVLGGRMTAPEMNGDGPTDDELATYPPSTPYIRVPGMPATWKALIDAGNTAVSDRAYGSLRNSWFYPRAWVDPRGKVFILTHAGEMFKLDTAGNGTLTPYLPQSIEPSTSKLSSVMFAPGKILSIRAPLTIDGANVAIVVDITGSGEPVVTKIASLFKNRAYGSLTVLADGKVWANG